MSRPSWDKYFADIAQVVATRADCTRRKVGAVIVRDHRIVATGYNGAPAGERGCLEGACPRGQSDVAPGSSYDTGPGSCIAVHAEANAIMYSSREDRLGAIIYITDDPCDGCYRLIQGSGITGIITPGKRYEWYRRVHH